MPDSSGPADPSLLEEEARAFDRQIAERIAHGHVPDLRRAVACDWFYNNPWRRPAYVELEFGEQFEVIRDAIRAYSRASRPRVLEVGCGPGFLSLELARCGFPVLGLDLSGECIEVCRRFAAEDPWVDGRAPLEYQAGDFLDPGLVPADTFDVVVFLSSLHHFPDQHAVAARVAEVLRPGGIVVAHDLARDRVDHGTAAFHELIEGVLSAAGAFHRSVGLPETPDQFDAAVERRFRALRYEDEEGGNVQSRNDNAAGYKEMSAALRARFAEVDFRWRYAFFNDFIGGLRLGDAADVPLARFLREMDRRLVDLGVLDATQFFFVGRMKEDAG